jgi:hypothetical protein
MRCGLRVRASVCNMWCATHLFCLFAGWPCPVIEGVKPIAKGMKMAGFAVTLRFVSLISIAPHQSKKKKTPHLHKHRSHIDLIWPMTSPRARGVPSTKRLSCVARMKCLLHPLSDLMSLLVGHNLPLIMSFPYHQILPNHDENILFMTNLMECILGPLDFVFS